MGRTSEQHAGIRRPPPGLIDSDDGSSFVKNGNVRRQSVQSRLKKFVRLAEVRLRSFALLEKGHLVFCDRQPHAQEVQVDRLCKVVVSSRLDHGPEMFRLIAHGYDKEKAPVSVT